MTGYGWFAHARECLRCRLLPMGPWRWRAMVRRWERIFAESEEETTA